ncbi:hypothetical protein EC988_004047 [Linderina pennispora]|nr:hypothetical protein EC988_004047 [Linderina pennispora]
MPFPHLTQPLQGLCALVTGASGGIGGATAIALARRGARVIIAGRNEERLDRLHCALEELTEPAYNEDTHPIRCDLRDSDSAKSLVKAALKQTNGKIDILVNAAGISLDGLAVRQNEQHLLDMMQVNLFGTMAVCKEVAGKMMRQNNGSIVNISSVIGMHGNVGQSGYAASKAGLIGYTKSLAKELGPKGICVNAVAPGFIKTEMTRKIMDQPVTKELLERIPLGRIGDPHEVAEAAAYLAAAKYVTGQVLVIDGGLFI